MIFARDTSTDIVSDDDTSKAYATANQAELVFTKSAKSVLIINDTWLELPGQSKGASQEYALKLEAEKIRRFDYQQYYQQWLNSGFEKMRQTRQEI